MTTAASRCTLAAREVERDRRMTVRTVAGITLAIMGVCGSAPYSWWTLSNWLSGERFIYSVIVYSVFLVIAFVGGILLASSRKRISSAVFEIGFLSTIVSALITFIMFLGIERMTIQYMWNFFFFMGFACLTMALVSITMVGLGVLSVGWFTSITNAVHRVVTPQPPDEPGDA